MLTVEILSAIGGSESTMKIYELAAIGQTFEEAFANVYGISWAEAKPILADLTASLHEDVYMYTMFYIDKIISVIGLTFFVCNSCFSL